MAKDPAVLFYTSDFLSGTYTLTDEQVGKYIRLLCLQHQKGKLTDKDMYRVCGTYDSEIFCKFIKEDDFYYNKKMYDETNRRKSYTESRRNNRNSTKNTKNDESYDPSYDESYVKHMETETVTINGNDLFINNILEYRELLGDSYNEFIEYWCEPNKKGKLRYELEKFFDVKRRVNTWIKNKLRYGNTKTFSATASSQQRMATLKEWVHS
jgi:hypothetical protein